MPVESLGPPNSGPYNLFNRSFFHFSLSCCSCARLSPRLGKVTFYPSSIFFSSLLLPKFLANCLFRSLVVFYSPTLHAVYRASFIISSQQKFRFSLYRVPPKSLGSFLPETLLRFLPALTAHFPTVVFLFWWPNAVMNTDGAPLCFLPPSSFLLLFPSNGSSRPLPIFC